MSKLVCEYCGNWMEDTDEKCPTCAAANPNHKRVASTTPVSIEELQQWYRDRNLPDEEITKFYIGKNVQVPGAYGIYKEYSDVVLYKNRADGTRAIRYKGSDEEYAVNELYLKLKEEILNQKARRQYEKEQRLDNRASTIQRTRTNTYGTRTVTASPEQQKKAKKTITTILIIFFVLQFGLPLLAVIPMVIFGIIGSFTEDSMDNYYEESYYFEDDCYYVERSDVFYYEGEEAGEHVVWFYEPTEETWYKSTYDEASDLPFDEDSAYYSLVYSLCRDYPNFDEDTLDITKNKTFIDDGHWEEPKGGYYFFDGFVYYMNSSEDKWYIYDKIDGRYVFVAEIDDDSKVPTSLYYYADEFFVSNDYEYFSERVVGTNAPAFSIE